MTQVLLEITMSLDGYVAGPDASLEDPLGVGGMALHDWAFRLAAWRAEHGIEGGEEDADGALVRATVARTGAVVMGRRMFSGGSGPWEDDPNANGGGGGPDRDGGGGRPPAVPRPGLRRAAPRAGAALALGHDVHLRRWRGGRGR